MAAANSEQVLEQIDLISRMIHEGRRSVEKWGWVFVLWGCAHLAALLWSKFWPSSAPWLIASGAGWVIQMAVMVRSGRPQKDKQTTLGRAVSGTWAAFGVSMIFLLVAGLWKHVFTSEEAFVSAFFILIGGANLSSGITLRFKLQICVGLAWWLGAVAIFMFPQAGLWIFTGAVLLCEIAFGFYLMSLEKKAELTHA
jgi:hypothetical protein